MFNNLKKKFEERGTPLRSTCPSDSEPKRRSKKPWHSERNLIAFDDETAEWASKCRTLEDKLEKQEADFAWEFHWKNEELEKCRGERRTLERELKKLEQKLNAETSNQIRGGLITGASGDFLKSVISKSEIETCEENENLRKELKRLIDDNCQFKNMNEKLKCELKQAKEDLKMAEELNSQIQGNPSWELKFIELQNISNFESKSLQTQLKHLEMTMTDEVKKYKEELKAKDFLLKAARDKNEDLSGQIENLEQGRQNSTIEEDQMISKFSDDEDFNVRDPRGFEQEREDDFNFVNGVDGNFGMHQVVNSEGEIDGYGYGTARCSEESFSNSENSDQDFLSCDDPGNLKSMENQGRLWRRKENSYITEGDSKRISKFRLKKTSHVRPSIKPHRKKTWDECSVSIEDVEESTWKEKNVPALINYYSKLNVK